MVGGYLLRGEPRTVADVRREAQERILRKFVKDGTLEAGLKAFGDALRDVDNPAHGIALKMCLERGLPMGMFEDVAQVNIDIRMVLEEAAARLGNVIDVIPVIKDAVKEKEVKSEVADEED